MTLYKPECVSNYNCKLYEQGSCNQHAHSLQLRFMLKLAIRNQKNLLHIWNPIYSSIDRDALLMCVLCDQAYMCTAYVCIMWPGLYVHCLCAYYVTRLICALLMCVLCDQAYMCTAYVRIMWPGWEPESIVGKGMAGKGWVSWKRGEYIINVLRVKKLCNFRLTFTIRQESWCHIHCVQALV